MSRGSFAAAGLGALLALLMAPAASAQHCNGTTDDSHAFVTRDTALGTTTGRIEVPVSANGCLIGTSISLNHQLAMPPGAALKITAANVTLTLAEVPIAAPQQQIFFGKTAPTGGPSAAPGSPPAGKVLINQASKPAWPGAVVYPEWWGGFADRGKTDNGPPTQAAANALVRGGIVQFGAGYYAFFMGTNGTNCTGAGDAVVVVTDGVSLHGAGITATWIMPKVNCASAIFTYSPPNRSGNVRDMTFDGEDINGAFGTTFGQHQWIALRCSRCGQNDFTNLGQYGGAFFLKGDVLITSALRNLQIQGCAQACIVLGGGTQDQSGQQHVSEVDIDAVWAFNLQPFGVFWATASGTTLTVNRTFVGSLAVAQTLSCPGCPIANTAGTTTGITIVPGGSGTGATGTYTTSAALTLGGTFTGAISGNTLTTTAPCASCAVGQMVTGGTVAAFTFITAGSGTTWTVSGPPQTVASATLSGNVFMGAASGLGMVIDSGANEVSIRRMLQGGMLGGMLLQNTFSSTGAHRPENIRILSGTNLSGNMLYGLSVQSAWGTELFQSSLNGSWNGPGAIVGNPGATFSGTFGGPNNATLTVSNLQGTIRPGDSINCRGCMPFSVVVSGSGSTWTVSPNQQPGLTSVAVNTIGVDGFQLRDGFHAGNFADNILIQAACNVSLRGALIMGANQFVSVLANTTSFSAVHATPTACGNLEVTNNNMGDVVVNNLTNQQAFGIVLDPGSFTDQFVNNFNRIGRVNIQGNMLQGNTAGAISDQSAPNYPHKIINNNLQ